MPLPKKIKLKTLLFGDGPGVKLQAYENQELGVRMDAVMQHGKWSETWTHSKLPGRGFPSYDELRSAYSRIEEEQT